MSDETSMNEHAREIAGQLCRWTLLAVTGAGLLVYVGTSVTFGPLAVGPSEARMVPLDTPEDHRYPGSAHTRVYFRPVDSRLRHEVLVSKAPDGGTDNRPIVGDRVPAFLPWPGGSGFAAVSGSPYGSLAFDRDRFWVQAAPQAEPVYFVDAAMVLRSDAGDVRKQHPLLKLLLPRALVVLLWDGPPSATYRQARSRAHGASPPLPVAAHPGHDGTRIVQNWSTQLGLSQMPVAITADPALAARLARVARTHLVGPMPARDVPEGAKLTYHATMDSLIDALQVEFAAQATQPSGPAVVPGGPGR